jgi:hypothetical protein
MKLIHFSNKIIKKVKPIDHGKTVSVGPGKPNGFWVSDESDHGWHTWCTAEEFRLENLKYQHEVELKKDANILKISNLDEFDEFNEKYSIEQYPGMSIKTIDWAKIKTEYQGIIISPYQWKRRLDPQSHWYYGWDCSSGVIFNHEAVAGIKLIKGDK